MKNKYSTHKRFIADVVRYTDPEVVSEASSHYILLRSCSALSDVQDEQIAWVVGKICNPDLNQIYQYLNRDIKGLSNQEIIFRIKRVKYIVNNADGLRFKPTSVLSDIGQMFKDMITIPYMEVRKMVESSERTEQNVNGIKESKQRKKNRENLEWILKNVSWKGRDGHSNEGSMDANEASKVLGISPLRIRVILKDYYKGKPLEPTKQNEEMTKEASLEDKQVNQ